MVSNKYQPLEDVRTKALEEARLRHEARHSRYGGKYNTLKETHSRADTERNTPDKAESRDSQSRGSAEQSVRRTTPIEDRNNRINNEGFERRQRENQADIKRSSERLEYMKQNHPDEYRRQVADEQKKHNQSIEIRDALEKNAKKIENERAARPENKWSRELSDKGRQTSDQARGKGREGHERDGREGHERTGR